MKVGDKVYCIDNKNMFVNTRKSSILKLKLNKPYTILNPDGGGNDLLLNEIPNIYFNSTRFISELEYKTKYRILKINKLNVR